MSPLPQCMGQAREGGHYGSFGCVVTPVQGRHGVAIVGGGDAREASALHPGPSTQALLPKCHNPVCCAPQEVVADRLSLCGRCQSVAYCSVECQRADWRTHKRVCCAVVEG